MKINHYGGWFSLRGLCSFIFGLLALFWPGFNLGNFLFCLAAYILIDGLIAIIASYQSAKHPKKWWLLLLDGVVGVVLGMMTFVWLVNNGWILILSIGAWALVTGILELAAAFTSSWPNAAKWLFALAGLSSVILGGFTLSDPMKSAYGLVFVIGIYASVFGIFIMATGWSLRNTQTSAKTV